MILQEARELNDKIFECIYYSALEASCELAEKRENIIKKYKLWNSQMKDNSIYDGEFISSDEYVKIKKELITVIPEELEREEYLGTYSSYIGSPIYHGKLQFDLWNKNVTDIHWNWSKLREKIKKYGIRNSLLVAPMPTASTAQILGNYECFEPIMSNIYSRRVLAGEYMIINEYLVSDLISLELWSKEIKIK